MKQSMAIAYALKKKAKKMADGGDAQPPKPPVTPDPNNPVLASIRKAFKMADGGPVPSKKGPYMDPDAAKKIEEGVNSGGPTLAQAWSNIKSGLGKAHGGQITDNYQHMHDDVDGGTIGPMKEQKSGFVMHEDDDDKPHMLAMEEDDRMLNQHGEIEEGPQGVRMADGGMLTEDGYQSDSHMMDMVGRIMKMRQKMFSEGGKVSNGGEDELDHMADSKPNNFDDLSMRDDLKENYTGMNSGDEIGNAQEEDDRKDIVSRIMKSRNKKDRMPHPA